MWFPGGDRSQIVDEELRMSSLAGPICNPR